MEHVSGDETVRNISNVACERMNLTLTQSLRTYCQKKQDTWGNVLPSVLMVFMMGSLIYTVDGIFSMLFGGKCLCLLTFRNYLMNF